MDYNLSKAGKADALAESVTKIRQMREDKFCIGDNAIKA